MNSPDSASQPTAAALRQHCSLLLSHFAWAEHRDSHSAQQAYQHGSSLAPMDHLPPLQPREEVCNLEVDQALSLFATTKPAFKARMFKALTAVALHDGIITTQERQLIKRFGSALSISHAEVETALTPPLSSTEPTPSDPSSLQLTGLTQGNLKQQLFPGPLTLPGKALILANLIPLFGVLFLGWDAGALLLIYWLENIVIGFYTLIRMFYACGVKAIGIAIFFMIHYSAFCGVHGMIVMMLSLTAGEGSMLEGGDDGFILFFPFLLVAEVFRNIATFHPGLLTLPLLSFVISHGISTVMNNLIGKEDQGRKAESIMSDPYRRVVILHVALIFGAGAIILSGAGSVLPILLLLIGMKIGLDLFEHNRNHRIRMSAKMQNSSASEPE